MTSALWVFVFSSENISQVFMRIQMTEDRVGLHLRDDYKTTVTLAVVMGWPKRWPEVLSWRVGCCHITDERQLAVLGWGAGEGRGRVLQASRPGPGSEGGVRG